MQIQEYNINSLRKELEEELESLDPINFDKETQHSAFEGVLRRLLDERRLLINNLDWMNSDNYIHYGSKEYNNVLFISSLSSDFINNLNYVAIKLNVPTKKIINYLIRICNKRLQNQTGLDPSGSFNIAEALVGDILKNYEFALSISHFDSLVVYGSNIAFREYRFAFKHIDNLIFFNIENEQCINNISKISQCSTVYIPKTVPKLYIYAKCNNIDNIVIYDSTIGLEFEEHLTTT